MDLDTFIQTWAPSGGGERANYVSYLNDLCDVLGVPRPEPTRPDDADNSYVFERNVYEPRDDGKRTVRRIDLYRRGSFVLEAKQGVEKDVVREAEVREAAPTAKSKRGGTTKKGHGTRGTPGWDAFMLRARAQAESYARLLPASEGRPPFVLVVDVGYVIEVYAEFTRTGGSYLPFPEARRHRITLEDLRDPEVRELLRTVWLDPLSLDPSLHAARVTRAVASTLAQISRSMEGTPDASGVPMTPERVSAFLMRMIFTMFAEDVGLIDHAAFRTKLKSFGGRVESFVPVVADIWAAMATGSESVALAARMKHFNGGLFDKVEVLPVTGKQLQLLIDAAEHDWSQVEPSIFGTLVERALTPADRHKLGAHYTPRAYVERLVNHVVITPLRDDWRGVQVEVEQALDGTEKGALAARRAVERFLGQLQETRVLDPSCGTGNFLYVSMELMKRLEAEVHQVLIGLGGTPPLIGINPEQFLGLELNPRAARVAELVLWIGYLQIYAREHGKASPPEPILRAFKNIREQDAVLAYTSKKPRVNESGQPVTRWDGKTRIKDPVTGREVPDPAARVQDTVYLKPTQPMWPMCDFIVGNPPFIGAGAMREALGDGYTEALRTTYKPGRSVPGVPDSADFVMFWWFKAAQLMTLPRLRRFGFVTTNSIKQTFSRQVIEEALDGGALSLVYALPDHPWVDEADGAAVRIAMTVAARGVRDGVLEQVVKESVGAHGEYVVEVSETSGRIHPNLTVGADVTEAVELEANVGLSNRGVQLFGAGFIVPRHSECDPKTERKETDAADLGLGRILGLEKHIREYRNGRDLTARSRGVMVIDLFGLTEAEVRERYPEVYQHVRLTVKPERDANNRATRREKWWLFGETNPKLRDQLEDLPRYIATVETSKHRFFQFIDASVLPDNKLVVIAHDDAYVLGVLSSRLHVTWTLAQGSTLEDRPVYVKSRCFETFPFPEATPAQQATIRAKAEALDAHRKARLAQHAKLTMTDMYNVMEKLRAGETLTAKDQTIHDQGLVTTLKLLHDELDALVQAAYGWEGVLSDQQVLTQLTALNAVRHQQERQGKVLYLRPEYQDPKNTATGDLNMGAGTLAVRAAAVPPFPAKLMDRAVAVQQVLQTATQPLTSAQVAALFKSARSASVEEVLDTLVLLGHVRQLGDETQTLRYAI
jgi:hypothetical protein